MSNLNLTVITKKDYANYFKVCPKTAAQWYASDLEKLKISRITAYHFAKLYNIDSQDLKSKNG